MQSQLQITLQDVPHSAALDERIREKVGKLEKMFPRLTACRVVISAPHHHQQHRRLFTVRLNIAIPGGEIVVTRTNHEDVYVLLRDAFVAARRELDTVVRRHDRDGVTHAERLAQLFAERPEKFFEVDRVMVGDGALKMTQPKK